jgi:hypothetical protein
LHAFAARQAGGGGWCGVFAAVVKGGTVAAFRQGKYVSWRVEGSERAFVAFCSVSTGGFGFCAFMRFAVLQRAAVERVVGDPCIISNRVRAVLHHLYVCKVYMKRFPHCIGVKSTLLALVV